MPTIIFMFARNMFLCLSWRRRHYVVIVVVTNIYIRFSLWKQ